MNELKWNLKPLFYIWSTLRRDGKIWNGPPSFENRGVRQKMSGKRRYRDHKREKGIKKQGKNTTGEKRVRLCENRRARSQTTSPLYIQPEQLETHDHRREKEKITLPHYSNHFLENEARRSPSLSPYLFSSLSSVHGGVCVHSLFLRR